MENPSSSSHSQYSLGQLQAASQKALARLLEDRKSQVFREGELATSALSTATAISALALLQKHYPRNSSDLPSRDELISRIEQGVLWLTQHQNEDGGWGDTILSYSNIATTMLVLAAIRLANLEEEHGKALADARAYVDRLGWIDGLKQRYGKD